MEIEGTTFGAITTGGRTYEHDVLIRLSGEVVKRKKNLSKKYYDTSHVLSKEQLKARHCDTRRSARQSTRPRRVKSGEMNLEHPR